jgi:hypothetical protein
MPEFDIKLICSYYDPTKKDGSEDHYMPAKTGGVMEDLFLKLNDGKDRIKKPEIKAFRERCKAADVVVTVEWMVHPEQVKIVDL